MQQGVSHSAVLTGALLQFQEKVICFSALAPLSGLTSWGASDPVAALALGGGAGFVLEVPSNPFDNPGELLDLPCQPDQRVRTVGSGQLRPDPCLQDSAVAVRNRAHAYRAIGQRQPP